MGQACSLLSSPSVPMVYTVASDVRLTARSSSGSLKRVEPLALADFLKTRCPSLFAPFCPPWWLRNGHLQTGYCVVGDFSQVDKVVYDRTLIRLRDGGTLGLDSTPPIHECALPEDAPVIVVMHGLTGGSHESYVRAVLAQAVKPKEQGGLGYRGIVVNFRGCAGVPMTSGQLYSAGHTDDLRQALMYVAQRYPNAPLLGLGFSLGANVIVRYLAEEGDRNRLRAACALGCPWDLLLNSARMEGSFFLRNVYSKAMASNLLNVLNLNKPSLLQLAPNRFTPILNSLDALKNLTLAEFDGAVTSKVGGSSPPHGPFPFPDADAYYKWASSHKCLANVRVPVLAINAVDDPIVGHVPTDVGDNGYVALVVTSGGGHLGWFEPPSSPEDNGHLRRWMVKPVVEWLRAVAEDLESTPSSHPPELVEDGEWTTETGRTHLGFKVLGETGEVKGTEGEGGLFAGL